MVVPVNAAFQVDKANIFGGQLVSDWDLVYANYFEDDSQTATAETYKKSSHIGAASLNAGDKWEVIYSDGNRGGVLQAKTGFYGLGDYALAGAFLSDIPGVTVCGALRIDAGADLDSYRWPFCLSNSMKIYYSDLGALPGCSSGLR